MSHCGFFLYFVILSSDGLCLVNERKIEMDLISSRANGIKKCKKRKTIIFNADVTDFKNKFRSFVIFPSSIQELHPAEKEVKIQVNSK